MILIHIVVYEEDTRPAGCAHCSVFNSSPLESSPSSPALHCGTFPTHTQVFKAHVTVILHTKYPHQLGENPPSHMQPTPTHQHCRYKQLPVPSHWLLSREIAAPRNLQKIGYPGLNLVQLKP